MVFLVLPACSRLWRQYALEDGMPVRALENAFPTIAGCRGRAAGLPKTCVQRSSQGHSQNKGLRARSVNCWVQSYPALQTAHPALRTEPPFLWTYSSVGWGGAEKLKSASDKQQKSGRHWSAHWSSDGVSCSSCILTIKWRVYASQYRAAPLACPSRPGAGRPWALLQGLHTHHQQVLSGQRKRLPVLKCVCVCVCVCARAHVSITLGE